MRIDSERDYGQLEMQRDMEKERWQILGISIRTINGKVERKMAVVKEFLETLDYRERRLSVEEMESELVKWIEFHNYSRIHFAYRCNRFGDLRVRKKVWFIPYLRFVCHRR